MDLSLRGRDLHAYIRSIEQLIIDTLSDYGIKSGRDSRQPGVWVGNNKIAAIGIAVKSGWISMHGFALNVNPDMDCYSMIVPCGIADKGVACMQDILGTEVFAPDLRQRLIEHYCRIFSVNPEIITLGDLKWL
jgi:lipoate-protein ligase B